METKFKALRIFAAIQILAGVLFLVAAVLVFLVTIGIISNAGIDERAAALFAGTGGTVLTVSLFLVGITWIAYGQFLQVVMQIEENTRKE